MLLQALIYLFVWIAVPLLLVGGFVFKRKIDGQRDFDANREWYQLVFPTEMGKDEIQDFITSIGNNLRGGSTWGGVPTVAFEVVASPKTGIIYLLGVHWQTSAYLITQLRGAIPGIDVLKLENRDAGGFMYGETIHMHNPSETLPISDVARFANRTVRSIQNSVKDSDYLVIQTIIAHSPDQKMPPSDRPMRSNRSLDMARAFLHVDTTADRDEVSSRRTKQVEQNYIAVTRVAARGKDIKRAQHLVGLVVQSFTAERGHSYLYPKETDPQKISHAIVEASTPLNLTMQLSVSELTAMIAWPIGKVYVAGLQRGAIQHMPVPESVEHEGIVIGKTTLPPNDRKIAISFKKAVTHGYLGGTTEVGKTTMLVNIVRQVLDQKGGLILLERDGNLAEQALNQVPADRLDDVIYIDTTQPGRYVGFNPLQFGKPEIVAGQFASLLNGVFKDAGESLYTDQLVRHGIPVLAALEKATLSDLTRLVYPRGTAEKAWQSQVISSIKDRRLKAYWEDWNRNDDKKKLSLASAFFNRMYAVFTPEPTRYMLSQEQSSFDPADVVKNNKILIVNLAGLSEQVASVEGSMIVNAVWEAAKVEENKPKIPNFMVLDEFHQFAHLREETKEMFATARKRNLGLWVATQYIERLERTVQDAVMANARNKLIFTSSVNSATIHNREFAHPIVRPESFVNLPAYTVLARVNTKDGVSDPITMLTYAGPGEAGSLIPTTYNLGQRIANMSSNKYGRTAAEIDAEEAARIVGNMPPPPPSRTSFGEMPYDPNE